LGCSLHAELVLYTRILAGLEVLGVDFVIVVVEFVAIDPLLSCPGLKRTEMGLIVHLITGFDPESRIDPFQAEPPGVVDLPQ
jgi:hypothetical protein